MTSVLGLGEVVSVCVMSTCHRNHMTTFNMADAHSTDMTDSDNDDFFARETDNLGVQPYMFEPGGDNNVPDEDSPDEESVWRQVVFFLTRRLL